MPAEISPREVGNKAANLMRMAEAGLPVPAGFVITTRVCRDYFDRGCRLSDDLSAALSREIEQLQRVTDQQFGGWCRPTRKWFKASQPIPSTGFSACN